MEFAADIDWYWEATKWGSIIAAACWFLCMIAAAQFSWLTKDILMRWQCGVCFFSMGRWIHAIDAGHMVQDGVHWQYLGGQLAWLAGICVCLLGCVYEIYFSRFFRKV